MNWSDAETRLNVGEGRDMYGDPLVVLNGQAVGPALKRSIITGAREWLAVVRPRDLLAALLRSKLPKPLFIHPPALGSPFPVALRAARDARGLKDADLAALTGLDRSYVTRLLQPKMERWPSYASVLAIADALDSVERLSPAERDGLLMAAGYLPRDPFAVLPWPELRALADHLATLPEDARGDALNVVARLPYLFRAATAPQAAD